MDILTTEEAANLCRLSVPTFERYRLHGDGPTYLKLGRAVRYRVEDVEAWLASRLTRSTKERRA